MKTNPARQPPASVPQLTDDLRPGLRLVPAWTISLESWQNSVSPAEARAWISGGKTPFLEHLDALAWAVILAVEGTPQKAEDWATALRLVMADNEAELTPEELDSADAEPLTEQEQAQLATWAQEAMDAAEAVVSRR